jgi:diguanylate cyclase (GGDEF)-like protein/PAS domain S-box-containing protein
MKENKDFIQLADHLFDGVAWIDANGRIIFWNKGAERITGYPSGKIVGTAHQKGPSRPLDKNGKELPEDSIPLLLTVKDGVQRETLAVLQHAEGYRVSVLVRTLPIRDEKGRITGAIGVFSENKAIISSFQSGQKTEETVLLDRVTGIGSRPHIENKVKFALEDYHSKQTHFGVLFMDIDHFKAFNDAHGHLVGDRILRIVANTLRHSLRLSDSCGRWGGEEFVALVLDLDLEGLRKVAEKLRTAVLETKVREGGGELNVTISIGATLARPGDTLQTLIERADQLMYKSKQAGRNRVTVGE